VSPAAVGVDIGCGMAGVPTNLTRSDLPDSLATLRADIEGAVPVGFNGHEHDAWGSDGKAAWDTFWGRFTGLTDAVQDRIGRAQSQMGTLGGGNHFIEVCVDEDDRVWLMLHSGSRNIGKEIADAHIKVAKVLEHNTGLPDKELAVLIAGTPQFEAYRRDLYWAQEYARRNRDVMLSIVKGVMRQHFPQVTYGEAINCHHNYVAEESYGGKGVYVTRKGAISAAKGTMGLIPGSMGTGSYVVSGLGNTDGFCSASHGAGRKMSRGAAKKNISLEEFRASVAGVECRTDAGVLDEAPAAYKDLGEVIAAQSQGDSPLVKVENKLTTLLCVKG